MTLIITLRQLIYLCHSDVLVLICLPISLIPLMLRYSNFILIMNLVGMICRASNEYAKLNKDKSPTMYSYYNEMTPDDFYKLVGIFIHLGYRKIPSSLCYDLMTLFCPRL